MPVFQSDAALPDDQPHPDAELIGAYTAFVVFDRWFNTDDLGLTFPEPERAAQYEEWRRLHERLLLCRPRTKRGVELMARLAMRTNRDPDIDDDLAMSAWDGFSSPPEVARRGFTASALLALIGDDSRTNLIEVPHV